MNHSSFQILLVGNYEGDGQYSMQKFASFLEEALEKQGIGVYLLKPPVVFGAKPWIPKIFRKWVGYVDKFILFPWVLKKEIRRLEKYNNAPLIVHICDHSNAIYINWLSTRRHLVTCHDLIAIRSARGEFEENATAFTGRILQKIILKSLKKSSFVACISESTKKDLLSLGYARPERTLTIPLCLNFPYLPIPNSEAMPLLGKFQLPPNRKIVLHVGNDSWYKNRDGLLRIFNRLIEVSTGEKPVLVLVGPPLSRTQNKFVKSHELTSQIYSINNISNEELAALYSSASVFLCPSLYEGFGWPPLEAQACGCPVVASDGGSLYEVLMESALICDAQDEETFVGHLDSVLNSDKVCSQLKEKGYDNIDRFTKKAMVEKYLFLYEEIVLESA